ncbi:MAG: hypothetical protein JXA91_01325 [Candidatus Thermoplasmatota archaeon]|nr:hypothetical protein [Candidatus Thermoplasmatota archaeon]
MEIKKLVFPMLTIIFVTVINCDSFNAKPLSHQNKNYSYGSTNKKTKKISLKKMKSLPFFGFIKEDSTTQYYENGEIKQVTLTKDWESPSGWIIKTGTLVELYGQRDGYTHIKKCTIAKDFKLPNDAVFKAGTELEFHINGTLKRCFLAKDWNDQSGTIAKAGTSIEWYDNGSLKLYTLATDWENPSGIIFKEGTSVELYKSGAPKKYTIAKDWKERSGAIVKAGTSVEQYENYRFKQYVLAEDWNDPTGALVKAGSLIEFHENGTPKYCIVDKDFKLASGAIVKAGMNVELYDNGKIMKYTLKNDWKHPSGAIFRNNTIIESDRFGDKTFGILAKDFNSSTGIIPNGSEVAIISEGVGYLVMDKSKYLQEEDKNASKGIHIIFSRDTTLIKQIKESKKNLWEFRDKNYYSNFQTTDDLDKKLKKIINKINNDQISDLFYWKDFAVIAQKK